MHKASLEVNSLVSYCPEYDGETNTNCIGDGSIGSLGNKVGGPLASDGAIGKQFEAGGGIGGTVQNMLGDKKSS